MKKKYLSKANPPTSSGRDLRQQAEKQLNGRKKKTGSLPITDVESQRFIHELQVHQIELELQNEELVQSRVELEAAFQQYTELYDLAPAGYFSLARDGTISKVNLAGAKLVGVERLKLIQKRMGAFVAAQSLKIWNAFLDQVFTSGKKEACEIELLTAGSVSLWAAIEAATADEQRETCRLVVMDITGRKKSEDALRASAENHRIILETAMDGFWLVDTQGRLLEVNEAYCKMSGYSAQELLAMRISDLESAEAAGDTAAHIQKIMAEGEDRFETRHRRKDGSSIDVSVSVQYRPEVGGQFVAFLQDITERKQAEEKQAQTYELLTNLACLVPGVIYQYRLYPDGSSAFPYSSPGMYSIYEVTPEQVREDATPVFGRLHPEDADRVSNLIFESARTLEEFYCEYRVILPEQGLRWRWSQAHPERTEDGGTLWHGIISDITERTQAEKEIQSLAKFPSENPNPTMRIAKDGTLTFINPSGKKKLPDWHLVEGQAVPPLLKKAVFKSMKEGKEQSLDLEHGKLMYSFFIAPIVASGYANAYGRDVTEVKQSHFDLLNSVRKLRNTVEGTIETIALIVEARDPYTSGHQQRVADISVKIAEDLGLTKEQVRGIYMAGLIHDLGKIQVPAEILSKPGQLTKLEFDMIKTHPKVGFDLLKNTEFPWPLAQIIYQHHEREDGSGYPRKLKGDKILMEAKIIGIADVIEAMSSHRPYRPALGMNVALDEIVKHKGTLYDTTIVASYLKVIKKGYKFSK